VPCIFCAVQFDESLIASMANEDLVDSLLQELQEDFPQLLKPLLHDRWVWLGGGTAKGLCCRSPPSVMSPLPDGCCLCSCGQMEACSGVGRGAFLQ
jgi:hypothetical protein